MVQLYNSGKFKCNLIFDRLRAPIDFLKSIIVRNKKTNRAWKK